ncbi:hypothetical protein H1R20_g4684, partial [Candolleomyces eurysporus]
MHLKVFLPLFAVLGWVAGSLGHEPVTYPPGTGVAPGSSGAYTSAPPAPGATGAPGGGTTGSTGDGTTGSTGGGTTGSTGGGTTGSTGPDIATLIAQTAELSTLNSIITQYPGLLASLSSAAGTLLAPSNEALDAFISGQGGLASLTEDSIQDLVNYHLLPLSRSSADLSVAGGAIAETRLLDADYTNLAGTANVIFASAYGSTGQEVAPSGLKIYSGVGTSANVTSADLAFEGGLVHVIDRVLNFPRTCTQTAETASLSTLLQAIQTTNLTEVVDTTPKFTCFAPTDAAFQAAGINISSLTNDQIVDALKYHSIVGDVGYSTAFEDGREYQTLLGVPVTVHKRDGQLFINDVAVQTGNVIMSNGVAHVLSGVLSPPANGTGGTTGGTSAGSTAGSSATPLRDSFGISVGLFLAVISSVYFVFA